VKNSIEHCAVSEPLDDICLKCERNYYPDADPITSCTCFYDTTGCFIPLDELTNGEEC